MICLNYDLFLAQLTTIQERSLLNGLHFVSSKYLRPGGSVGSGVVVGGCVVGTVGAASGGISSQISLCKNSNSSTATKSLPFLPFNAQTAI